VAPIGRVSRTIDIDTGGTFTDGFLVRDDELRTVKTATTPHDLTVSFFECIEAGARAFGLPVEDLLYDTDLVRFCTTIGTNSIIERSGARLGLLVSEEDEALAPTRDPRSKTPLIGPDMVAAIRGSPGRASDASEVVDAAQTLLDRVARCLVVGLGDSDVDAGGERAVREIIQRRGLKIEMVKLSKFDHEKYLSSTSVRLKLSEDLR
jgi:N-methylhydantoinase A/acetophenone carboxylase